MLLAARPRRAPRVAVSRFRFCSLELGNGTRACTRRPVSIAAATNQWHGQVLGAETLQTKEPDKTFELLRRHVDTLRTEHSMFFGSRFVLVIERNLGFEAEHLFRACADLENAQFVKEAKDPSRIGVLTTLERKQEFVTYANVMLRETRLFAWDRDWVNTQKNKTRTTLYEQLSFFGYTFSAPENHFQREKFAISGKAAGGKDDLCMALLIGMYVGTKLRNYQTFVL